MIQTKFPEINVLINDPVPDGWQPDCLPSLSGINEISFDTETSGLQWWRADRPVGLGISVRSDFSLECICGRCGKNSRYIPWGHRGGNHDEALVKRWVQRELRNKRLIGLNIRFDIQMMREWGVDLEAQGCTFGDLGHYAALLDDNRFSFSLESIAQTYLHSGKIQGLNSERMAEYHACQVAPYGRRDVELGTQLITIMWPDMEAEELLTVAALEDSVIPVVLEMERNACLIDVEKLNRWVIESEREVNRLHWQLIKDAGFRCDPARNADLIRLFEQEKINVTKFSEKTGRPSFDAEVMAQAAKSSPLIDLAYTINKIHSLRSKYLVCYQRCVDYRGRLRTSFHQMRADDGGTVSGRFSSSAPVKDDPTSGVNVQQVFATAKQIKMLGDRWIIRELYVSELGKLLYGADAEQIEFRLFAHYSGSPHLIQAYRDDPKTDFHNIVMNIIKSVQPNITRKLAKDCNFAKIYGAGQDKVAVMLGLSSAEAAPFIEAYDTAFPEAGMLLRKAAGAAARRGWVKTMSGRRARFPERQFLHSALNRVIQGTAADIMKRKLVELYNMRKELGLVLRMTVHDEVVGDVPDKEAANRVSAQLDVQTTPTTVPILWSGHTGRNWREVK
jgi:DNA polymerase I-like protein with 3'-5' exonuclease and polymerase domains